MCQKLCVAKPGYRIDRFYFDEYQAIDNDVDAESGAQLYAVVDNR